MRLLIIILLILVLLLMIIRGNESFDIPVYDSEQATYNIGDILNTPWYWTGGNWPIKKLRPDHQNAVDHHKGSIGNIYFSSRPEDEDIPNEDRIRESTDEYIKRNGEKFQHLIDIVSNEKTLTAHIRSGDSGVIDEGTVEKIKGLASDYDKIFILSGIHSDKNWFTDIEQPKTTLNQSLDIIKAALGDKAIFDFSNADVHLCLMRKASNLFLHKGGFSMLGGILFQGKNLYISNLIESRQKEHYTKHLSKNANIVIF